MGYRVKGTLKLPDGSPASNAEIEFISRRNFSPLVQELKSNILCGLDGAYDVTLELGEYAVIVYPGGTYPAALGTIIIAADTVAGQDLPTLLQQADWQPATPEYIQQIAQWLAEANASATRATASASAAKVSETNSKASETAAEADRSEVAANTADVRVKHSDVVAKSAQVSIDSSATQAAKSTAVSAADTATQKALAAAESEASAFSSAAMAELSAASAANSAASASAAVLDAERRSLERATGGKQTIIYDAAGNANAMFVLPRFRYEDLGMTADMGSGDVTAFDFGSGRIKSEVFIAAHLASGSGAVSAPRLDPRTSIDHGAARAACAAKGAGWHLMTAHEWAAIALWCMANGYEPVGNTNWGRSHAKTWLIGDRGDRRAPGDASGTGLTFTGSMGAEATHDRTLGGIADLVGNAWEWQDGFLLQDGRFKLSAHNTQDEASWAFAGAYLDASTATGGKVILSHTVSNRLGALGDNANAGNSANTEWKVMAKSSSYVSSQALKRLLIEPAGVLPQGQIYMRNFGERLPYRGGVWSSGAGAGFAAIGLDFSRADTGLGLGFRSAFA